jgi:hypothetical protein
MKQIISVNGFFLNLDVHIWEVHNFCFFYFFSTSEYLFNIKVINMADQ